MLPDTQPGFCLEGWTKSKFFAQKLSDLGFVLTKPMQLKRVTNGGTVIKYKVTMDGGLGAQPPAAGRFLWLCRKKEAIFTSF